MRLLGNGAQTFVWQWLLVFFSISHFVSLCSHTTRQTVNLSDNHFLTHHVSTVFNIQWSSLQSGIIQILSRCKIPSTPSSFSSLRWLHVVHWGLHFCWFVWQGVLKSMLHFPCYGTQATLYWAEWWKPKGNLAVLDPCTAGQWTSQIMSS